MGKRRHKVIICLEKVVMAGHAEARHAEAEHAEAEHAEARHAEARHLSALRDAVTEAKHIEGVQCVSKLRGVEFYHTNI
jgi:hypothetical protein